MTHEHDEEPFTLEDLHEQDEWNAVYEESLAEGRDEDTAREIANYVVFFRRVGPDVYYGVSRND